jgi:Zn-dependent M28 family amino/carboxypeptidase
VLASDTYEGRAPGSSGERYTVGYIVEQFKGLSLYPGNPDGSFVQQVPLIGFRTNPSGSIRAGEESIDLKNLSDWVAVSRRAAPEVKVDDSELVFVGYGVVAPEYGWDDYKGLDVKGKTLVMLVNDPPVTDPADASKLDPSMFKGRAMTYYGRWTYKYEIASEKGAAAALLVHEEGPAGYPFQVVVGSWGRENFDIPRADGNAGRVGVEAWITLDTAKRVLSACGKDFATLKEAAAHKDFQPVPLGAKATFKAQNTLRTIKSQNVAAKVQGSDPKLANELVVYTAHWDHLGRDTSLLGDQVFNGAADNASGVAGLLELAQAYIRVSPPRRSVLFLAVTAEEKGLLGAKYYAEHPLYPLEKTVANINMDVLNLWGRTSDVVSIGFGASTLDEVLVEAAAGQGRVVVADTEPEKGFYYRSDHFEFAKQGVPALDTKAGMNYLGRPADYGKRKREEYTKNDYHKVTDEIKPDWDLSGALDDLRLLFDVGYRLAQADHIPAWKPGAEFRAKREEMLKPKKP